MFSTFHAKNRVKLVFYVEKAKRPPGPRSAREGVWVCGAPSVVP